MNTDCCIRIAEERTATGKEDGGELTSSIQGRQSKGCSSGANRAAGLPPYENQGRILPYEHLGKLLRLRVLATTTAVDITTVHNVDQKDFGRAQSALRDRRCARRRLRAVWVHLTLTLLSLADG